jgi:hypothetical protein
VILILLLFCFQISQFWFAIPEPLVQITRSKTSKWIMKKKKEKLELLFQEKYIFNYQTNTN